MGGYMQMLGAYILVISTVTSQLVLCSDSPIFIVTVIIQLCQGKYSFPFYGTFNILKILRMRTAATTKQHRMVGGGVEATVGKR